MPQSRAQDGLIRELKKAGSDALSFNAPLSLQRAFSLMEFVGSHGSTIAVDFGCGAGTYLRLLIEKFPSMNGLGIDLDAEAINAAGRACLSEASIDRLSFAVADASLYEGTIDASVCIGSSHVFGDAETMLRRLREIQPFGVAVIGDGVWMNPPDEWCASTFGDMPSAAEGLGEIAERNGWKVLQVSMSSLAEWDEFEFAWNRGVSQVGTDLAQSFAAQRADEYQRYRGVLGFAWLQLERES